MSLNKVLLIGNVGKDPEVRHLESGASVATITLATSERFKDKTGNLQESTEWHTVIAWRQLADLAANYIRKGSQIYVEGRIRTRNWDDQNGIKHYVTEIQADSIQLLGRRADAPQGQTNNSQVGYQQQRQYQPQPQPQPTQQTPQASTPIISPADINADDPDDLPF